MQDQADELRHLVRQFAMQTPLDAAPRPTLVVVAGAKGGVGTTTVAVNLAAALSLAGNRVVLADADSEGAGVELLCRTEKPRPPIAALHRDRRSSYDERMPLADSLLEGPTGMRILSGAWSVADAWDNLATRQERMIAGLRKLDVADWIVADAGDGSGRMARRLWQAADSLLLVTTVDPASVMSAYASIKVLAAGDDRIPIRILVNMAPDGAAAHDAFDRLARACLRFLGLKPRAIGFVPRADEMEEAARHGRPVLLISRDSPAARAIEQLSTALTEEHTATGKFDSSPQ